MSMYMVFIKSMDGKVVVIDGVRNVDMDNDGLVDFVARGLRISIDEIDTMAMVPYDEYISLAAMYKSARDIDYMLAKRLLLAIISTKHVSCELDTMISKIPDDTRIARTIMLLEEIDDNSDEESVNKIIDVFKTMLNEDDVIDFTNYRKIKIKE